MTDETSEIEIGKILPRKSLVQSEHFFVQNGSVYCFRPTCAGCDREPICEKELVELLIGPGADLRGAFSAHDGWILAAIDYRQIEIRVACQLSGETFWLKAFLERRDLHDNMAREGWKIPESQPIPKATRDAAKCCNFGNLFLGTPFTLARQSNLSIEEATIAHRIWWSLIPNYTLWVEKQKAFARKHAYVSTYFTRRRELKDLLERAQDEQLKTGKKKGFGFLDRTSVNSPVQGTAADLMKLAMVRVSRWLQKEGLTDTVKLLLTVHDELVFEVKEQPGLYSLLRDLGRQLTLTREGELLPDVPGWKVPIEVDIEIGPNWSTMKNLDKVDPEAPKNVVSAYRDKVTLVIPFMAGSDVDSFLGLLMRASKGSGMKVPLYMQIAGEKYRNPNVSHVDYLVLREGLKKFPSVSEVT